MTPRQAPRALVMLTERQVAYLLARAQNQATAVAGEERDDLLNKLYAARRRFEEGRV